MEIILEKDIVSLTDFARQTRKHTEDLKKNGRPRVLTHNGKAAAVVLSVKAFDQLMRDADELRMDKRLKEALETYAQGERGMPLDQMMAETKARIRRRKNP